ncbi:MAG TPA: DUF2971 domain-containing protein [Candidatus Angelobacter sp.]|nr:DUF2971 domain-containing protein [Candidatus Angelobacter sp.]
MRVYHFLPAKYAIDDIKRRRLKIATLDDLNDPFDLWAVAQPDPRLRQGLRAFRSHMACHFGMLCFSTDWENPLLWSHYGDRHRGMVLGIDVNDEKLKKVKYVRDRPVLKAVDLEVVYELLFTKFQDWQYEAELRMFAKLKDRDHETSLYFGDFGPDVTLREVISGPLCDTPKSAIEEAVGPYAGSVTLTKARLAFNSFRVVTNQRGFSM